MSPGGKGRAKTPRAKYVPPAKVPAAKAVPARDKTPRSLGVDQADVLGRKMVWRFADVDHEGWGFGEITSNQVVELLRRLRDFESMTIGEIFKPGSEVGKTYEVAEMPAAAQRRLVEADHDDETEVSRLRCSGKIRLYGFLREHVFHVLWWDPEHEVWPSTKRHT